LDKAAGGHEEVKEMRRHWLRGVLLGASLALLLAGGVALALGAYVSLGKSCIECFDGDPEDVTAEYLLPVSVGGWGEANQICGKVTAPVGDLYAACNPPWDDDPHTGLFGMTCDLVPICVDETFCPLDDGAHSLASLEDLYGVWTISVGLARDEWDDSATFLFAEVCEPEFVPEPGSILLLGSGLAGLAGYATLRLRSRTRE
jgi:hypothetical protein